MLHKISKKGNFLSYKKRKIVLHKVTQNFIKGNFSSILIIILAGAIIWPELPFRTILFSFGPLFEFRLEFRFGTIGRRSNPEIIPKLPNFGNMYILINNFSNSEILLFIINSLIANI
jgi:hypothetical protein